MCGILGIVGNRGRAVGITDPQLAHMRDTMTLRGPDASGMWREPESGNVALAHRRLAVVGLGESGDQPMHAPADPALGRPRFTIVYNGELYNDASLRNELSTLGVAFRSSCDTETVLRAFETWGLDAIPRFRGMFAFGIYDAKMRVLTLARDALGVKPLYYATIGRELVFASDVCAILAHPGMSATPNLRMVSAYMTTIRAVLAGDTMFEGIHSLPPGEMMLIDLDGDPGAPPHAEIRPWWTPSAESSEDREWAPDVRACVSDSLAAHLRADVPTCALLSGGIDSAITATLASERQQGLRTYCAGDGASADNPESDFFHARDVAQRIGSLHAEAPLDQESFHESWRWMVAQTALPMCTPNETAIHTVASRLRADGCVVTISGEGADELFAGYEPTLDSALAMVASSTTGEGAGLFELNSSAWVPTDFKSGILDQEAWHLAQRDRWLMLTYEREFKRCVEEAGGYSLAAHQRFSRRINLTGLLRRLDNATMLASVEGRTPFADIRVAELAERVPIGAKYIPASVPSGAAPAEHPPVVRTKLVLREAFKDTVPRAVLERPKASFPLPFQSWISSDPSILRDSPFAKQLFQAQAIETVSQSPTKLWNLAWPMMNLALWGDAMGW